MLSNSFAGIAPASAPGFIAAQLVGAGMGWLAVRTLYPGLTPAQATTVVLPHPSGKQSSP
jgi:hypothetical protein